MKEILLSFTFAISRSPPTKQKVKTKKSHCRIKQIDILFVSPRVIIYLLIFLDILALNTLYYQRAYLINSRAGSDKLDFEFDNGAEVYNSCSLQWQNHYYVFGGLIEKRQVSRLNGNRLERKGTLEFDFLGACTVLNQLTIVLCFDWTPLVSLSPRLCRKSNNPLGTFAKLPHSNYDHSWTRIASFDGKNTVNRNIQTLYFRHINCSRK